jgi:SAM-dependent methyltransferase
VEDGAFEVALCQQGFQFFPDREAAATEMRRALEPGGRLAVATWTAIESNPFGAIAAALAEHMGEEASQMMHSPFHLTREELAEAIAAGGFGDVEVIEDSMMCTWAAPPSQFARLAIAAGPIQPLFGAAPEEAQQAVADQVGERLAGNATPDGGGILMPMTTYVALARA